MFNISSKIERGIHNCSDHTDIHIFIYSLSWTNPQWQLVLSSNSSSCCCSGLLSHRLVIDGQRHISSSQDGWLKKNFFSWSISGIIFLLCRRLLAFFPYNPGVFLFLLEASILMKLQRKWLIKRKEAFNCPLCWFPESRDYLFSALSWVKQKVTKSRSHPSVARHIRKCLKIRPNGGEYLFWGWRYGKERALLFLLPRLAKKKVYYGIPWATARCRWSSICAADTVEVVTLPQRGTDHLLPLSVSSPWPNFSTTFQINLRTSQLL